MAVQAKVTPNLMRQPEILGTAVGVAVTRGVGVLVGLGVAVGVAGTVGVGVGDPPSRACLMACSSGFRCPAG